MTNVADRVEPSQIENLKKQNMNSEVISSFNVAILTLDCREALYIVALLRRETGSYDGKKSRVSYFFESILLWSNIKCKRGPNLTK